MGRKSELNQEMVDQICDKIKAEGNIPTVDRVRLEAGTGSRTTINKMIREYEKKQKEVTPFQKTPELQLAIDKMVHETGKIYAGQIKELQSELEQTRLKVTHYMNQSEKHLSELEELQGKQDAIKEENSRLQIQLENSLQQIKKLESKIEESHNINQLFKMLQMENAVLQKKNRENQEEQQTLKKQYESMMDKILKNQQQLDGREEHGKQ